MAQHHRAAEGAVHNINSSAYHCHSKLPLLQPNYIYPYSTYL